VARLFGSEWTACFSFSPDPPFSPPNSPNPAWPSSPPVNDLSLQQTMFSLGCLVKLQILGRSLRTPCK